MLEVRLGTGYIRITEEAGEIVINADKGVSGQYQITVSKDGTTRTYETGDLGKLTKGKGLLTKAAHLLGDLADGNFSYRIEAL